MYIDDIKDKLRFKNSFFRTFGISESMTKALWQGVDAAEELAGQAKELVDDTIKVLGQD